MRDAVNFGTVCLQREPVSYSLSSRHLGSGGRCVIYWHSKMARE